MTTLFTVEDDKGELWWSLQEVVSGCQLETTFVLECVEVGVADARGPQTQWRFDASTRARLLKAWRLHRDLELQVSALPLVLDLLEEVDTLRYQAEHLRSRLRHWEHEY